MKINFNRNSSIKKDYNDLYCHEHSIFNDVINIEIIPDTGLDDIMIISRESIIKEGTKNVLEKLKTISKKIINPNEITAINICLMNWNIKIEYLHKFWKDTLNIDILSFSNLFNTSGLLLKTRNKDDIEYMKNYIINADKESFNNFNPKIFSYLKLGIFQNSFEIFLLKNNIDLSNYIYVLDNGDLNKTVFLESVYENKDFILKNDINIILVNDWVIKNFGSSNEKAYEIKLFLKEKFDSINPIFKCNVRGESLNQALKIEDFGEDNDGYFVAVNILGGNNMVNFDEYLKFINIISIMNNLEDYSCISFDAMVYYILNRKNTFKYNIYVPLNRRREFLTNIIRCLSEYDFTDEYIYKCLNNETFLSSYMKKMLIEEKSLPEYNRVANAYKKGILERSL